MKLIDVEKIDFSCIKDPFDRARAEIIVLGCPSVPIQDRIDELKRQIEETAEGLYNTVRQKYKTDEDITIPVNELDIDVREKIYYLCGMGIAYEIISGEKCGFNKK